MRKRLLSLPLCSSQKCRINTLSLSLFYRGGKKEVLSDLEEGFKFKRKIEFGPQNG